MSKSFIITKDIGGQAYDSTKIENYMGYDFITGPELVRKFQNQLLHTRYVDHKITEVEKIEESNGGFKIITSESEQYESNAFIIATGMMRRKLDIPGEAKLL